MSYFVKVPIEVINATHQGGYRELYLKYVQDGYTSQRAWEIVEEQLERYGFPPRYSSYYSFRKNLWRARKELKEWRKRHHECQTII